MTPEELRALTARLSMSSSIEQVMHEAMTDLGCDAAVIARITARMRPMLLKLEPIEIKAPAGCAEAIQRVVEAYKRASLEWFAQLTMAYVEIERLSRGDEERSDEDE